MKITPREVCQSLPSACGRCGNHVATNALAQIVLDGAVVLEDNTPVFLTPRCPGVTILCHACRVG